MKGINIILDTDAGSDCDDMLALGYLLYAQKNLGIRIKAVTYSHVSPNGAAAIRSTFEFFGEEAPPIGVMTEGTPLKDHYAAELDRRFAKEKHRYPALDAVSALRKTLAESEEKAVICAVGPLTNISALLKSQGDDVSPLSGIELVKEKCAKMVLMAGRFIPDGTGSISAEWNVKCDIDAARNVATLCPVPLAWLPHETGLDMITGRPMKEKYGMSTPISASFFLFQWAENGRHSWDPAAALYTVEGCGEFFKEIKGKVTVDENGVTHLQKDEKGSHCVIVMNTEKQTEAEAKQRTAEYLDRCVMALHKSSRF